MISIWHLLWIIPASFLSGVFCIALLSINRIRNVDDSIFQLEEPFENYYVDGSLQVKKRKEQE